jgi:hypothetical protein
VPPWVGVPVDGLFQRMPFALPAPPPVDEL